MNSSSSPAATFCRRPDGSRRYAVIACEVLFREICHLSASCPHVLDHVWLSQGLHDLGAEGMSARISAAIDALPRGVYDAVLLGFGLCNNGVVGLRCDFAPLVVPKAHDCITLFLGSRERYRVRFEENPGTYTLTTGWMERDESRPDVEGAVTVQDKMGLGLNWDDLCALYGEENARYLTETLGDMTVHYSNLAYIRQEFETHSAFEDRARAAALERGWSFEVLPGDLSLLRKLLYGDWDEDFAVVPPGETIRATYGEDVLGSCGGCGSAG